VGPRRPIAGGPTLAVLNCHEPAGIREMRVAQYRVALPAVPCNSAYQEHEPYSIRAHPGWMNLFKHHHKGNDATDAKVARRSQSTVTRPQGVLDLMENSWYAQV